jgi:proline iminopeptidase
MRTRNTMILTCLLFSFILGAQSVTPQEGYITVKGGNIWYKIINEGSGIPLIHVHGGPGGTSCGAISFYERMNNDRPVILFDQLGSGFSDPSHDTNLWKLPEFVDQLDSVINFLQLANYHLLGSSWGASIVIEFILTRDTSGLKAVIFSGPLLGTNKWMEDAKILVSELPSSVRDTISKYEAIEDYDNINYQIATDKFYAKHMMRNTKVHQKNKYCVGARFNNSIYQYMWGPTEFNATGTLRSFNRIPDLPKIKHPTLFIAGEYDEVRTETLYYYQSLVEGSQVAVVPESGHSIRYDNPEQYYLELHAFLESIERAEIIGTKINP